MKRLLACLVAVALLPVSFSAQESVDWEMMGRIRTEGLENSKVMDTLWYLTDRYGPRLTNSPQQRKASQWAREHLEELGLANAAIEPWGEFGLGWSFERSVVEMTDPIYMPLIAYPKAWTRGLDAPVAGEPILISAESIEDLEQYRGKLAGKIVLNGKVNEVEAPFEALAKRHDAESLAELVEAPEPGGRSSWADRMSEWRKRREVQNALRDMLEEEGAAVVIEPDGGRYNDYGVVTLGGGGSYDPAEKRALPQAVVSTEQFNRIARLIQHEVPVQMRVDLKTTFYDDDTKGYDVVAEIPGTDPQLADELVMLGAHFDSWHPATGTTDNGSSCAVVMEAARILKAVDARPRRTIRVALWTGEEQGLLGSRAYVERYLSDAASRERLSVFLNDDPGSGRTLGFYMQDNPAAKAIFDAWIEPLRDLGAGRNVIEGIGSTDHVPFDDIGLPAFTVIKDFDAYDERTRHTNADYPERMSEAELSESAIFLAHFAWQAAQRDGRIPRKPVSQP